MLTKTLRFVMANTKTEGSREAALCSHANTKPPITTIHITTTTQ